MFWLYQGMNNPIPRLHPIWQCISSVCGMVLQYVPSVLAVCGVELMNHEAGCILLPSPLVPLPFLSPSPPPLWPQRAMFPETIVSSGIYQLCRRQEMEQDKMRTRQLQEIEYVAENYSPCSLDDTVKINHILTSSVRYCLQMLMKFTLK